MPRIQEYTPRVSPGGPTSQAKMSGAAPVAQAVSGFGQAVGNIGDVVYKRKVQRDLSQLDSEIAKATAELTLQLKDQAANADPNDDKFAENFIQDTFESRMQQIAGLAKTGEGQRFFRKNYSNMQAQFMVNAGDYQTELAAVAAKDNYVTALNSRSSAVEQDPSNFENLLRQNRGALSVMTGLTTKAKIELGRAGDRDIAMAAAKGWIDLNPTMAKKVIEDGKYDKYISGEDKVALLSNADRQLRMIDAEAARAKREAEHAQVMASEDRLDALLPDIVQNKVSILELSEDKTMREKEKRIGIAMVQYASSPEHNKIRTDPATFIRLWDRIHLEADDPERLTDPEELVDYLGSGLTLQDVTNLRHEMRGTETVQGQIDNELKKQWMATVKSALTGTNKFLGLKDPNGDTQVAKYMSWALPRVADAQNEGKSLAEILDPDGEYFKSIQSYKRPLAQQINDMVADNIGNQNLDLVLAQGKEAEKLPEFKSADDVVKAYKDRKISRDQATQILHDNGWAE